MNGLTDEQRAELIAMLARVARKLSPQQREQAHARVARITEVLAIACDAAMVLGDALEQAAESGKLRAVTDEQSE